MDFLEDFFDRGDRKRHKKDGFIQNHGHHDDNHDDHNDPYGDHDDDHQDHRHPNQTNPYIQVPTTPGTFLAGVVCRSCSTQTVQGAKFCHACGVAIQQILICASCGSKLPENAVFCSQCGYKNG